MFQAVPAVPLPSRLTCGAIVTLASVAVVLTPLAAAAQAARFSHLSVEQGLSQSSVQQILQDFQTLSATGVAENMLPHAGAVQRASGSQESSAERGPNRCDRGAAGSSQLVRNQVGIDDGGAMLREHLRHHAFAAANAASQAD